MSRILIAEQSDSAHVLEGALNGHELSRAETLKQAERLLFEDDIALFVIEASFDESRSMEFLRCIRESRHHARTPVVMVRFRDCQHANILHHTFAVMKGAGSISAYVESDGDNAKFRSELRKVVETCIKS